MRFSIPIRHLRPGVARASWSGYHLGTRTHRLASLALLALTAACAARSGIPDQGVVQPGVEEPAVAATAPAEPHRIVFAWSLRESDARFSGKGVARVAPPYRGRLDLFGPRGEGYLQAVLVGSELRLPAGVTSAPLPPPSLLWSTLGVIRPPEGTELVHAVRENGRVELVYAGGEDRWRFVLENDRLVRAEHERPGMGKESVTLEYKDGLRVPARSVYRDWTAFRELVLTVEEVNNVDSFPGEIWTLAGR